MFLGEVRIGVTDADEHADDDAGDAGDDDDIGETVLSSNRFDPLLLGSSGECDCDCDGLGCLVKLNEVIRVGAGGVVVVCGKHSL